MRIALSLAVTVAVLLSQASAADPGTSPSNKRKITIGMIAKLTTNPVFAAAYTGARVASSELGEKFGVDIEIDYQSPREENVNIQAATLERMIAAKIDGIAVASSDATVLTPLIDKAMAAGIPVVTFDADAPKSKRFAYCGPDDREFGKMLIDVLSREISNKGKIAILAGNKNALNQQRRLQSIKDELKKHSRIQLSPDNIYHNIESPDPTVEMLTAAHSKNPDIVGWISLGSWPLLVKNSLPWKAGDVKFVAGNAVPAELDYVRSGHVQALAGVNCFQMGHEAVELLVEKIVNNKTPASPMRYTTLKAITRENVEEWASSWKKWLATGGAER